MNSLSLALDWTPNINHIGFFVAQAKGFYKDAQLAVSIIDPSHDGYAQTPAKKVELGKADFALCPTESILSYRTKSRPFPLIALAAIFKEDLSGIAVREDSGIQRPKDLDGKKYGSYEARYEDQLVGEMIRKDGGKGDFQISYPNKLGIWDRVIQGECDATWVFLNWEGVEAEKFDTPLRYFKMKDYGVPYSYSPVIAANESLIPTHKEAYTAFLSASKKGFLHCQEHPEEAVEILKQYLPEKDEHVNLQKALKYSAPHFGNASNWGQLKVEVVRDFLAWIYAHQLETKELKAEDLFSNELNIQ